MVVGFLQKRVTFLRWRAWGQAWKCGKGGRTTTHHTEQIHSQRAGGRNNFRNDLDLQHHQTQKWLDRKFSVLGNIFNMCRHHQRPSGDTNTAENFGREIGTSLLITFFILCVRVFILIVFTPKEAFAPHYLQGTQSPPSKPMAHCLCLKHPGLWVKITSPLTFAVLTFERTSLNHTCGQLQPPHNTACVKPSPTTTDMSRLVTACTSLCSPGKKAQKSFCNLGREEQKKKKILEKYFFLPVITFLTP